MILTQLLPHQLQRLFAQCQRLGGLSRGEVRIGEIGAAVERVLVVLAEHHRALLEV